MRGMVNLKYALEHRPEMRIRWPSYGYCGGGCTIVTLSSIFPTTSNLFGSLASDLGGVEQSIAAIATESRRTEEGSGQEKTRPFLTQRLITRALTQKSFPRRPSRSRRIKLRSAISPTSSTQTWVSRNFVPILPRTQRAFRSLWIRYARQIFGFAGQASPVTSRSPYSTLESD
jgi:hypothetical protein